MARAFGTYVAVLDRDRASAVCRAGALRLPLDGATVRPQGGDRVALLSVHGPLFFSDAAFVGTADVLADDATALKLRHRVLAPPGWAVALRTLSSLRVSAGRTHVGLGALRGEVVRCTAPTPRASKRRCWRSRGHMGRAPSARRIAAPAPPAVAPSSRDAPR